MNRILIELEQKLQECLRTYLPEISASELEENDSGWSFVAGNEGEEYINDYRNIVLMAVGAVYQRDPAILPHIDSPVGARLVRVSTGDFEPDEDGKEIYMEQRK